MMRLSALGLLAMTIGAQAQWVQQQPEVRSYSDKHSLWVLEKSVPAEHEVVLTVALKVEQERRAMLEEMFWKVSDPKHEMYGKHLSMDEITNVLAIPQERVGAVTEYFQTAGASVVVAPNKDMMTVTMPAASAETALKTKLGFFTHSDKPAVRIVRATTTYSLPQEIDQHVALVGELLQFPRLRLPHLTGGAGVGAWPNACASSTCAGLVTPAVLAERYKLPKNQTTGANNSMAVAEFQGQYYKPTDLKSFSDSCHRDVTVAKNVGANVATAGVESELDIEYIKSVATDVPLTVVYDAQFSLIGWVNQITSLADTPLLHSVSYGNDEKQQTSTQYMETCNTAFMKAGARGLSILFASGDQGVCGRSGCGMLGHARFHPDFPAGSPYITSVGGTDFVGDGKTIGPEMAWTDGGGGFSDTFDIPDFQKAAVAAYKASADADLPPQKLWNNTGRGYPDIAALGGQKASYCVATGGRFAGVAGTSAACPVAAGVFVLLNGLRAQQKKPPLGFLNPFIYQNPTAFNDVESGVNTGSTFRKYGFKAIKGWDAATGWGTPDYEALAKVVVAMSESPADSSTIVV